MKNISKELKMNSDSRYQVLKYESDVTHMQNTFLVLNEKKRFTNEYENCRILIIDEKKKQLNILLRDAPNQNTSE